MNPETEMVLAQSDGVQSLVVPFLKQMADDYNKRIDKFLLENAPPTKFAVLSGKRQAVADILDWIDTLCKRAVKSEPGAEQSGGLG
jgi:uncharacterized protein YeeX (DUF496 family)